MNATRSSSRRESKQGQRSRRRGDAVFSVIVHVAGILVVLLIGAIAVFLALRALPSFRSQGFKFFTESSWFPDADPTPVFGIAALAFGTVVSSIVALVIAVPVALGSALFLTELAPPRLGRYVGYVIDLLAAVPSVVFGLWGLFYLRPRLDHFERTVDNAVGSVIPIFHSRGHTYGKSLFLASVILAIMILPIVAAISREIFKQVPRADREAALALGATRWEMMRISVLPYSRSGIVGAVMLGLGRALGETIAVALVLGSVFSANIHLFEPGGNTIAANIATKFGESGVGGRNALIASGLVLFAITLVVNVVARSVVYRAGVAAEGRP